jgi:hypothetical protein
MHPLVQLIAYRHQRNVDRAFDVNPLYSMLLVEFEDESVGNQQAGWVDVFNAGELGFELIEWWEE